MKRKLPATKLLTLSAMVVALCVLCLFAASMFNAARVPLILFASACIYVLTCEGAYLSAILVFIASTGLSYLLAPDKTLVLIYALLPGHYGIIRSILHSYVNTRPMRLLLKLIYCDLFIGLGIYLATVFFGFALFYPLPVWALVLILQGIIIIYDAFYGAAATIYENRMRSTLIPRR